MKYLKKISMLVLLWSMCFATNVQALGLEHAVISPEGLQIYMVPYGADGDAQEGANGEEKKSFWLYVEMIGKDKKPYVESEWKVEGEIYNLENGTNAAPTLVLESSDFQLTEDGIGFWVGKISIITKYQYKDHELVVRLLNGEQEIAKRQEVIADLVVEWPKLLVNSWKVEASDFENLTPGIVTFDWENATLFERLFQVEIEHSYENLKTEHVGDNTWQLKVDEEFSGELIIRLTDKLQKKADVANLYTYSIEVSKKSFPIGILLLGILVVGGAAVVVVFKLRGGKVGGSNGYSGKVGEFEDDPFELDEQIEKAKSNLAAKKDKWKEELEYYIKQLENNKRLIETYGSRTQFFTDLQSIDNLRNDVKLDVNDLEEVKAANELRVLLRKGEGEDTCELTIRNLNEKADDFEKKKKEYNTKTVKLPQEIAKWKQEKEELERPLGMDVEITVTKTLSSGKQEVYVFDSDHNACGFVLDEKIPLKLDKTKMKNGYEWDENRNFEAVFGKKLGIKIAATTEDYILLTAETEKKLKRNERYEFTVVLSDGNFAEILVMTT